MKAKQLEKSLEKLISIKQPCFIWGGVGVGKSEIVHKVAKDMGYRIEDVRIALLDPVDLRGVPKVEDGRTVFCPPVFLPSNEQPKTLLFLDELPQGSPSVQNALFQLIKDRKLGEYTLPEDTVIVSAGNRVQDKAGANRVNTALGDRFVHLNLDVCHQEWIDWGIKTKKIKQEVLSFISWQGEDYLYNFDKNASVNATPRAWEYTSNVLATDPDSEIEQELYAGIIGEGIAPEFIAFVRRFRNLPSVDVLLKNPEDETDLPIVRDYESTIKEDLLESFTKAYIKPLVTGAAGKQLRHASGLRGFDDFYGMEKDFEEAFPETAGVRAAMKKFAGRDFKPFDVHANNVMMRPKTNDIVIVDLGRFNI